MQSKGKDHRRLPTRYYVAFIFFVLAFVAYPTQGLDRFAPETTAVFEFHVTRTYTFITETTRFITITYPNGTVLNETVVSTVNATIVPALAVANGFVTVSGKGGLSAGNPLDFEITMYTNKDVLGKEPSTISVTPQGAFAANVPMIGPLEIPFQSIVPKTTELGFPEAITLAMLKVGDKWLGGGKAIYNQGGTFGLDITVDNVTSRLSDVIVIDSEAVTVAARTNSLLVCLTWVIIAFTVMEIRLDNGDSNRKEHEKERDENRSDKTKGNQPSHFNT